MLGPCLGFRSCRLSRLSEWRIGASQWQWWRRWCAQVGQWSCLSQATNQGSFLRRDSRWGRCHFPWWTSLQKRFAQDVLAAFLWNCLLWRWTPWCSRPDKRWRQSFGHSWPCSRCQWLVRRVARWTERCSQGTWPSRNGSCLLDPGLLWRWRLEARRST